MLPEDIEFTRIYEKGLKYVLTDICGFNETQYRELITKAEEMDRNLDPASFQERYTIL
jgi:hypothetical protein